MTALTLEADLAGSRRDVSEVPPADINDQQMRPPTEPAFTPGFLVSMRVLLGLVSQNIAGLSDNPAMYSCVFR